MNAKTTTKGNSAQSDKMLRAFVTGYSPHKFTMEALYSELSKVFPYIADVVMPLNAQIWKGYAFVDFDSRDDFLSFIRQKRVRLDAFEMNLVIKAHKEGKVLQKFIKDVNKRKVCIKEIPTSWDDIRLEQFFLKFGKVENAYVEKKLGQEQRSYKGMVIFCAKRCAVECSSLKSVVTEEGHQLKVSLFVESKSSKESTEQRQKTMESPGNQQRTEEKFQNMKKKESNNSQKFLKITSDREEDFHQVKPTSKVFFRVNYLDIKAHVCCFDNIRFNYSTGRNRRGCIRRF